MSSPLLTPQTRMPVFALPHNLHLNFSSTPQHHPYESGQTQFTLSRILWPCTPRLFKNLKAKLNLGDVGHSRRQLGRVNSQEQWATQRQLLTPIGEATLTKWALQYHAWGLPLQISHLKQFAPKKEDISSSYISHTFVHRCDHLVV